MEICKKQEARTMKDEKKEMIKGKKKQHDRRDQAKHNEVKGQDK